MRTATLLAALAASLTFVVPGLPADEVSQGNGTPEPVAIGCEPATERELAVRAPNIFVGQVLAVRTGDVLRPYGRLDGIVDAVYTVEVIRTLKGMAAGTVEVFEDGFFANLCWGRPRDESALRQGEKAFFVVGVEHEGRLFYLRWSDRAAILLPDGLAEEALVARFSVLQATPVVTPRASPAAPAATLTLRYDATPPASCEC